MTRPLVTFKLQGLVSAVISYLLKQALEESARRTAVQQSGVGVDGGAASEKCDSAGKTADVQKKTKGKVCCLFLKWKDGNK